MEMFFFGRYYGEITFTIRFPVRNITISKYQNISTNYGHNYSS